MVANSSCFRKSNFRLLLVIGLMTVIFFSSCKDEIIVGSTLLDDELILVDVTDQIQLRSKTEYSVPFSSFDSLNQDRRVVCLGILDDNIFGKLTTQLALSFNINTSFPPNYPIDEKPLVVDSLVLVLTYDTLGTYGDLSSPFHVEINELTERIPSGRIIKSDTVFSLGNILADTMVYFKPQDSVSIINPTNGNVIRQIPQLRIKLSGEFADRLLHDKLSSTRDSAFVLFLKGINIKATPMNNNGMVGFNLSTLALSATTSNKLIMYYTESDTAKKVYNYNINRRFVNTVQRDYVGSMVEQHVLDSVLSDQISYIQGFAGPLVVVSLPNLDVLRNKIINYAELTVKAEKSSGMFGKFDAAPQIIAQRKNENGTLVNILDVFDSLSDIKAVFGGEKKEENGIVTYKMNITNHLKQILKNPSAYPPELYLTVFNQRETIHRSIIFGANHELYKMRLKVNFTTK